MGPIFLREKMPADLRKEQCQDLQSDPGELLQEKQDQVWQASIHDPLVLE